MLMMEIQAPDEGEFPKPPGFVIGGGAIAAIVIGVAIGTVALIVFGFLLARLG